MNDRADEMLREADKLAAAGDYASARQRLQAVLDLPAIDNTRRSWALHAMAHAYLNGDDPAQADAYFEQITQLFGAHTHPLCEAHVALGYAHAAASRWGEARESFARALEVKGALPCHRASARFHTAKSHYAEGDHELARRELKEFLKMPQPYPQELRDAKELLQKLGK
jgi:tetratricopeptide (TPR) repeat protein